MKSTFNICFYAKKDKQKAGGAYPLFARITVDGVASRFNTKLDVLPEMWDGKAGKAIGRTAEAGRINRMLSDINASLNTIYHEMQRRDNYVTAEKGTVLFWKGLNVHLLKNSERSIILSGLRRSGLSEPNSSIACL